MNMKRGLLAISASTLLGGAIYLPLRLPAASDPSPSHVLPPAEAGGVVVGLCDGETSTETYPKYQTQLQRVALLRDMINWCIENPIKGKPLSPDDPRLRALEAYIISQRNGTALAYGKH